MCKENNRSGYMEKNFNVNTTFPGYLNTDNTIALRENPVRYPAILSRSYDGRRVEFDDFKEPAVFLTLPASDYIHGKILTMDGNWTGR